MLDGEPHPADFCGLELEIHRFTRPRDEARPAGRLQSRRQLGPILREGAPVDGAIVSCERDANRPVRDDVHDAEPVPLANR